MIDIKSELRRIIDADGDQRGFKRCLEELLAAYDQDEDVQKLRELAHELNTQDNAFTAHPQFVVQQKRIMTGIDTEWTDNVTWVEDCNLCDKERQEELEKLYEETGDEPEGCTRTGYEEIWEHVQSFFTRKAAQQYIDQNKHRMVEPRIYVESAYRNYEWQFLTRVLLSFGE